MCQVEKCDDIDLKFLLDVTRRGTSSCCRQVLANKLTMSGCRNDC